jgi:threonyl-tRNA synthetase
MLIPVHNEFNDYCQRVQQTLHNLEFYCDVDFTKATFQKKVRNAQVAQYNFQFVVGKQEVENSSVNIRTRENEVQGEMKIEDMVSKLIQLRDTYQ